MERKSASKGRILTDAGLRGLQHAPGPTAIHMRPKWPGRKLRRPFDARQINPSAHSAVAPAPCIVDDLPEVIPVGAQELDVIETHLGALLNQHMGLRE